MENGAGGPTETLPKNRLHPVPFKKTDISTLCNSRHRSDTVDKMNHTHQDVQNAMARPSCIGFMILIKVLCAQRYIADYQIAS